MEIEQGDIVLCNVDRIVGTTVFLNIEGTDKDGSMVFSEVAPGRIRNIRDYVVPKKTVCCKVLKVTLNNVELSLRRVKEKEKKEAFELLKIEKSYRSIMKSILKEKTKDVIETIKKTERLYDFLDRAKTDSKELDELIGSEDSKKIIDILKAQKEKTFVVKKKIQVSTSRSDGLILIKDLLSGYNDVDIKYVSAGNYSVKSEDKDVKKADLKIREIFEEIQSKAKNYDIEVFLK